MSTNHLPRLAVIGATGAVGSIVVELLESREFPCQSIRFFASPQKAGRTIQFRGESIEVEPLVAERIRDIDLAIGSTPDDVAQVCGPWIVNQGGVFVDESAAHRMAPEVPLVVPEINSQALHNHAGIIASPNCSTTQLVVCLKPIWDQLGIRRVVCSTYQAASGAGEAARHEFLSGSQAVLSGKPDEHIHFESPLPFNLWPKIGRFLPDGSTSEETKMVAETRKILGDDQLQLAVTCVRVPVDNCHCETVFVETEQPVTAEQARLLFEDATGITVVDSGQAAAGDSQVSLPTPRACNGRDDVCVGRIRTDSTVPNGFSFWCVSDNLRKGAATNAVQIAEQLVEIASFNPDGTTDDNPTVAKS